MRDYLAFTYSHIDTHSNNSHGEGVDLATKCLKQLSGLNNPGRFPPRLLILLTSPEYLESGRAEQLLAGIHETFTQQNHADVQLIGCSVAAVFCDQAVYPKGALLICLASRLIKVQVAVGKNARQDPERAIKELLTELGLNPKDRVDPNPLANRLLLSFLPGFKIGDGQEFYPAPQLHRLLREGVQARIGLVGGVCSAGNCGPDKDGLLYAGRNAFKDAVVTANISSGIPIGIGLSYCFEPTGKVLQVTEVAEDQRTILAFGKYSPAELFEQEGRRLFLVKLSTDGEPTIDLPQLAKDGKSIQLLRRVRQDDYFQVAKPHAEKILKRFKEDFVQAQRRILIENPIACLTIICRAWYNCFGSDFDIGKVLEFVRQEGIACVGGFFDGELGVDKTGRSLFINTASSCLIFGDEMRERAPLYQVVEGLAEFGPLLNDSDKVIEGALKIVRKTGFPGAMLSLVVRNREDEYIIARGAIGKRFEMIRDLTRYPMSGNNVLAVAAREIKPRFIPDSRKDPDCDPDAMAMSQLISQYILPLKRLDGTVFGILQVDLGDLSYQRESEFVKTEKARVLKSLAEIFEAGLNRVFNDTENTIIRQLDQALNNSLSATGIEEGLQKFIEQVGKAFGVQMGHVRLAKPDGLPASRRTLTLVAGFGPCYDTIKKIRREISAGDRSLIYRPFRDGKVTIINDVRQDKEYKALRSSVAADERLTVALEGIKSFAAVAFKDEENDKLGVLSLAVEEPWFFTDFQRAIYSLPRRITFLIEHLLAKNRLEFLFKVSTKLAEIDLDEMPKVLEDALEQFSKAMKAEVAALYLWDEDREKFVLQAQYGWKNPEWVNAASYTMDDNWIGVKALESKPLYIADLHRYYKDHQYKPGGRYAPYMFGQPLSDSYTVEAIGLPLEIGKQRQRFGILTLYRHIEPGHAPGFFSTYTKLLEEGVYKMAGLVNALREHRNDVWQRNEQSRRQAVYEAINLFEVRDGFEEKTCQQVLESYKAAEVVFYKSDELNAGTISWTAGYRRDLATNRLEEVDGAEPDKLVRKAVSNVLKGKKKEKVAIQRRQLRAQERHNPQSIAVEGLVERVCIPLVKAQKLVGVLDLRWHIADRQNGSLNGQQGSADLYRLGQMIGEMYGSHLLAKKDKQSTLAVQATGAYVFQWAHRLMNAFQNLYSLAQAIKQAKCEEVRRAKIDELIAKADEYNDTIRMAIDMGERVQIPALEKVCLYDLVKERVDRSDSLGQRDTLITVDIGTDLIVLVSRKLLAEIFDNLIENAFNALKAQRERLTKISLNDTSDITKDEEEPALTISADFCNDKKAIQIVFEDNGVGMTAEEIENAKTGFVHRDAQHKGVGVLISTVMALAQGGSLEIESEKGKWTRAIVTLSAGTKEGGYYARPDTKKCARVDC